MTSVLHRQSIAARSFLLLTSSLIACSIIAGCRQETPPASDERAVPAETTPANAQRIDTDPDESQDSESQANQSQASQSGSTKSPAPVEATTQANEPASPSTPKSLPALPPGESTTDEPMDSPNVGDGLYDEEYEIDPEIQAHIDAHRRALRRVADMYQAPPGAKQIGQQADLWVDMKSKRVYVDGYVAMQRGPLEMFACPVGSKEHESMIALFAKSSEVHAALLAVGASSGTPVRWEPEFAPPTGQTIAVWVMYRPHEPTTEPEKTPTAENTATNEVSSDDEPVEEFNPSDEFHVVDARTWIRNVETQTELQEPWVFAGSVFWKDPEDGTEHYSADAGDMICVSNFASAMLDVPFQSSADAGNLMFEPFSERVPERGTPVRLVLVPQPAPGEEPATELPLAPTAPPDETMLQISETNNP